MPNKNIEELNTMYFESENADQELFSEQRSNILLVGGIHYNRKGSQYWSRIRSSKELSKEAKLRLTKNHIQKVTKTYINNIVSGNPSVKIMPRNETEAGDRKSAKLNEAIWQYGEEENNLKIKYAEFAKDYVEAGECFVKIAWDPNGGEFLDYAPVVDETGQPQIDPETGEMQKNKDHPVFRGKLEIEQLYPSNILRDPSSTSIEESPYLVIRKMVKINKAKEMVGDDPVKLKYIIEDSKDEFMVFDGKQHGSVSGKDETMFREFYFRPSPAYPKGYYYITTRHGILYEGELPFGIFPIEYVGWDKTQTSPRHRSIIKQLRPYQMEINRTASKIAEHQVTSDDKILIQSGTKISSGGILPGVRGIQYSGVAPTILQGRTGEQYLPYLSSQISEMYQVAMLAEDGGIKQNGDGNPWSGLFKSIAETKKFVLYTNKFEDFIKRIAVKYLRLGKEYFDQEHLIPALDKSEHVNIAEFKSTDPVSHRIKVVPMSDDINTMHGKTLAINHVLQYAGGKLEKEDIGKMIRNLPFGNMEESFSDLTVNYDSAENFVLALERGESPQPNPYDNNPYMINRLISRIRMSDFKLLDPQIQQRFQMAVQIYDQQEAQKQMEIMRAKSGYIPSGGALAKTDLQVSMPNSTGGMKTTRAVFPIEALEWLNKQLQAQGSGQERIQEIGNTGGIADVSRMINQERSVPPQGNPNQQIPPSQAI